MSIYLAISKICNENIFFSQTDGIPVWEEEDSGGDAEAESEGAQPSHERPGPRANETGAAGEKDHC